MKNQKGSIVLMIVGIIAFIVWAGGIGYLMTKKLTQYKEEQNLQVQQQEQKSVLETEKQKTQQPEVKDETADWKTYRNDKYWFEMRYPIEYEFIEQQNGRMMFFGKKPMCEDCPIFFVIEVKQTSLAKEEQEIRNNNDHANVNKEILTVDSNQFAIFTYDKSSIPGDIEKETVKTALIEKSAFVYLIYYNHPVISQIFNKILSTFKFVDETAEWRKQSLDWVEFKIPSGWELLEVSDQAFVLTNKKKGRFFSFTKNRGGRGGPAAEYYIRYDGKVDNKKIILSNREFTTDSKEYEEYEGKFFPSPFFRKGVTAIIVDVVSKENTYSIIDEGGMGDYESVEKLFIKIVENILLADKFTK